MRILNRQELLVPPDDAPRGLHAFEHIMAGVSMRGYSGQEHLSTTDAKRRLWGRYGHPALPRGAVCPAVVDELDVPTAGGRLIDPKHHSAMLQFYYDNTEETVILHESLGRARGLYTLWRSGFVRLFGLEGPGFEALTQHLI